MSVPWVECYVLSWTPQYVCPMDWIWRSVLNFSFYLSHRFNIVLCNDHLSMSVPWFECHIPYRIPQNGFLFHWLNRPITLCTEHHSMSVPWVECHVLYWTPHPMGWMSLSVLNATVCLSHGLNVTFFIEHLISWVECHFLCWTPQYVCFTCRTRTCAWASQHHRHRLAKPVLVCLSVCLPAYLTTCLPACLSLCLCHSSELYLHNALYTALRDHMPHMREHCMTMIIPDYFCYNLRCSRISVTTAFLYK